MRAEVYRRLARALVRMRGFPTCPAGWAGSQRVQLLRAGEDEMRREVCASEGGLLDGVILERDDDGN